MPRDHWLEDWEKHAIVEYYMTHPLDGYRRLTFMMLDEDVVAVSPSSVYGVLRDAEIIIQAARARRAEARAQLRASKRAWAEQAVPA